MKFFFILLCILLCLLAAWPALAAAPAPVLVVVLLPGTSLQNWQQADAPHLHHLMQTGALAVMNTRTAHRPGQSGRETPASALLTLGAGSRAAGSHGESADLGYDLHVGGLAETLAAHGIPLAAGGGPDAAVAVADSVGGVVRAAKLYAVPGRCVVWDASSNVAAADSLIGDAAASAAKGGGRIVVLSPYPSEADYAEDRRLTPILLWGKGVPAGLLSSPSTRRAGLVTNTDFAPSVAASFGILRSEFRPLPFGFAWTSAAASDAADTVVRLSGESVRQMHGMRLLPYLALGLGVWIVAATLWAIRRHRRGALGLVPIAALAAALFAVSAPTFGALLLGFSAFLMLASRFVPADRLLPLLAGGITLALLTDPLTGSRLMHTGLLGYSAIEGARYYGLGNEAMGLLLGCSLVCLGCLWGGSKLGRFLLTGLMAATAALLGTAGAKAGGVVVSLAVFGTFLGTVSGRRWTARTVAAVLALMAVGVAAVALADAFLWHGSHIGEAVRRMAAGGAGEAWDIVRRKAATEGRLAYHSAWAALLWPGLLCTLFFWKRAPAAGWAEAALRAAGIVGVAACLLLNDAGVVAAAIFTTALWSAAARKSPPVPVEQRG